MSFFENPEQLKLLQELLNPQKADDDDTDDSEHDIDVAGTSKVFGPGNIGVRKQTQTPIKMRTEENMHIQQPNTIEEWQEMQEKQDAEILDTRKCPLYNIVYRQAIGTEDVFLQMGNRSGATASCEDMILEILLPGETTPVDKMGLHISETEIELSTPIYRLKMPLVHKVDVDRCSARYASEQEKLILTLRLVRELDFVNF